jgi:predicted ATPase/DNA-binding SARP family transcriptional activator/DNA-binding CsgD family transcriptional regulator
VSEGVWHLRKAKSLVKLLALAPGHRMHREQLMELLWPNLDKRAASNNLRGSLHAARTALASYPAAATRYLASKEERIVLCPEVELWVDVETFEEAASAARRSREPAAYRAAIEFYGGELLPEDRYEEWAEAHRLRLGEIYLSLLIGLARVYEERSEYELAVETLRRAVAEEPANEEVHVALMRLYAFDGSVGKALAQYTRLEEALLEVSAEPTALSYTLREEIASGRLTPDKARDRGRQPEEPAITKKHNLPAPRDAFVGREHEILEVKRALAMTRLLTLTGAGGSGKTRLALEIARNLVGAYPDGVWLVELAPLSEGALVPQVVADTLGVSEQPGRPPIETLIEALREKELLLALDNCEHLVDGAARLVDALLDSCPRLRVLATSRESLGVSGEINLAVPTLSLPEMRRSPTVAELEGCESARLFVERAQHRNFAFALTEQNAAAVAEICLKLDGMPLAIELAAARVGLSAEQIAARLNDLLRLLTKGNRTAATRHQTMRGALNWSRELLGESEQTLFDRLSVFAGGWALEDAEAVVSGDDIEKQEVLDLLSGLVDKSLVVAEAIGSKGVRYRMLEPVRQYARENLEEAGEAETVGRRHAEFFLAVAEEAEPELFRGLEMATWLRLLEEERDNMRGALSWALEHDETELGVRLSGALGIFWELRGPFDEGQSWLEATLAKGDRASTVSIQARAKALTGAGWCAIRQGDIDRAETAGGEGLELLAGHDGSVAIYLRLLLGAGADTRGDWERATELFEESLTLSREAGDGWCIGASLNNLGLVAISQGDHERASSYCEEAAALCRRSGYPELLATALSRLGYVALLQSNHERAAELSEEALALCRQHELMLSTQDVLATLGWTALVQGDYERARALHKESLELSKDLALRETADESLGGLACVAGVSGQSKRAARLFGAAEAFREAVSVQQWPVERALREPYLDAARSRLGVAAWEEEFAEGKAMSLEVAIEYALSEREATLLPTMPQKSLASESTHALTRREEEVTILVAQGLTNRHIASKLTISEHTVDSHVAKILRKLRVDSRTQIAAWATRQDLLRTPAD